MKTAFKVAVLLFTAPGIHADTGMFRLTELANGVGYFNNVIVVTNEYDAPAYQTGGSAGGHAVTGVASIDSLCRQFKIIRVLPFYSGKLRKASLIREVSRIYLFFLEDGNAISALSSFNKDRNIESAELYYLTELLYEPDDPYLDQQWNLIRTCALEAWDTVRGDTTRHSVIAIIDTGVNWNHIDLAENIWINQPEDINCNGFFDEDDLNGIDDDGNGFIDDVVGWDFAQDDNYPMPDTSLHGTAVAGSASEVTDNGVLGAGMGFSARIMCVKGGLWSREIEYYYQGMIYAADNGAHIINCSWATSAYAQYQQNIVNAVWEENVLIVAGAGNAGNDQENYPAAYLHVMATAGTDQDDHIAEFSSYGTWVDICAPAVDIWVTWGEDEYRLWGGTSFASPLVAGLAALLHARFPAYSNDEIEQLIEDSADPIDDLNPGYEGLLGAGRINAMAAVTTAIENEGERPIRLLLYQNYPNPFNSFTVIEYFLHEKVAVSLTIYDITGRQVTNILEDVRKAGQHTVTWDARDFPSGVYFALLEAGEATENIKMVLLK